MIEPAMSSIISGLVLMAVGAAAGWLVNEIKQVTKERAQNADMAQNFQSFMQDSKTQTMAIKNMNRAFIIDICNRALKEGFISETSFKCLCELEETYHLMHGNSYTDELIEKVKQLYQHQTSYPLELDPKTPICLHTSILQRED